MLPGEDGGPRLAVSVIDALWAQLSASGFEFLLVYDPIDGLRVHPDDPAAVDVASTVVGRRLDGDPERPTLERLPQYIAAVVDNEEHRAAVVMDYASRIAPEPERLSPEQQAFFAACEKLALEAWPKSVGDRRAVPLFNPIVWLVGSERDLPSWLVTQNESVRSVVLPLPDATARQKVARMLAASFADFRAAEPDEQDQQVDRFTQQTEGMTLQSMLAITTLAVDRGLGMGAIEDAARAHRVGILDNPWRDPAVSERIANGAETLGERVIGQGDALRKSLDIMIRSVTGLTGAHGSPYATRPRGVLFFAGPTGVGKTELAKALTELVFWDENAYIRFDMSEFSSEHTAARLIGAPPGYTGFDAGGELTNAVRERPFSLILFDEIEKADSRILDKFLQILEDGRLTDGRGATVYFSESILVFTSNLGIYGKDENGEPELRVTPGMKREDAERTIRGEIKRHFTEELGRPELLNRLGDNIVVFDFIDREAGERIFDLLVRNIVRRVEREYKAELLIAPAARAQLLELALRDLANGGRGIGTVLENALVNPLARELFARSPAPGDRLEVSAITPAGRSYTLELT
jgi:ATP-dependent Clp protease ATP-binding subunit ClpA